MANYQRTQIDLSTRIDLVGMLLDPARKWGQVTELAQAYGVSRKFIYQLKARGQMALGVGLAPRKPGPQAKPRDIHVDRAYLRRAVTTLSLLPPSLRNLQMAMELLFEQPCSLGFIQHTLQVAGKQAQVENEHLQPPHPMQGELDEIFQTGRPCLTVIDAYSALALNLASQPDCGLTTWGVTLLDLQRQGVQFEDLASDGSQSIQAGIQAAQLGVPYRPDWFHLLQSGHAISKKLELHAYASLATAERAHQAQQEAQAPKRRAGRPLKEPIAYPMAAQNADQALHICDLWDWLFTELRQTLQPIQPAYRLVSAQMARQTLILIIEWMHTLPVPAVIAFANNLAHGLDALLAPFEALEQQLAPWRAGLSPEIEAWILESWLHRQSSDPPIERDFPPTWRPVVVAFWEALTHFHRSSCLAECIHSWIRPFFTLHRGMPTWLLPLLQAFWNHHIFQRGKRRGQNPLTLAGISANDNVCDWLNHLLLQMV